MPVNINVELRSGETFEHMFNRFTKKVRNTKLMVEIGNKKYYIKPSEKKRKERLRRILEEKYRRQDWNR